MKGDAESGGVFRATFEDKIAMSDIVFCRVWVPVPVSLSHEPTLVSALSSCFASDQGVLQPRDLSPAT